MKDTDDLSELEAAVFALRFPLAALCITLAFSLGIGLVITGWLLGVGSLAGFFCPLMLAVPGVFLGGASLAAFLGRDRPGLLTLAVHLQTAFFVLIVIQGVGLIGSAFAFSYYAATHF